MPALLSWQHGMLFCLLLHGLLLVVFFDLCVQPGCYCQAVTVRLYALHGLSLSALPASLPCLFIIMDEVVAT